MSEHGRADQQSSQKIPATLELRKIAVMAAAPVQAKAANA
jgi:hypothetical protein